MRAVVTAWQAIWIDWPAMIQLGTRGSDPSRFARRTKRIPHVVSMRSFVTPMSLPFTKTLASVRDAMMSTPLSRGSAAGSAPALGAALALALGAALALADGAAVPLGTTIVGGATLAG